MIIITFFRRFAGLGCLFAAILILALLKGAFTESTTYTNEMLYLEEKTEYSDAFDSSTRKVGNVSDQYGKRYVEALVYKTEGIDRYQLRGEYAIFKGTVFVPANSNNQTKWASQILVYGDGKLLWTTSALMRAGSPNQNFVIDVHGVEVLEIRHIGYGSTVGIGNFSLENEKGGYVLSPVPGYTRLLDVPSDSQFRCRYTDCVLRDQQGNEYRNTILYQFGLERFRDEFHLNGQYATLSGTIFIPEDRNPYPYFDEGEGVIRIFGDGVLLYESPKMDGIAPVDFTIDISGVRTLTITYVAGSEINRIETGLGNLILR